MSKLAYLGGNGSINNGGGPQNPFGDAYDKNGYAPVTATRLDAQIQGDFIGPYAAFNLRELLMETDSGFNTRQEFADQINSRILQNPYFALTHAYCQHQDDAVASINYVIQTFNNVRGSFSLNPYNDNRVRITCPIGEDSIDGVTEMWLQYLGNWMNSRNQPSYVENYPPGVFRSLIMSSLYLGEDFEDACKRINPNLISLIGKNELSFLYLKLFSAIKDEIPEINYAVLQTPDLELERVLLDVIALHLAKNHDFNNCAFDQSIVLGLEFKDVAVVRWDAVVVLPCGKRNHKKNRKNGNNGNNGNGKGSLGDFKVIVRSLDSRGNGALITAFISTKVIHFTNNRERHVYGFDSGIHLNK